MRIIDEQAIRHHADLRFRSEYDYALFEYYRSAKVIGFLERAAVPVGGRILDAGCGGGGMTVSLAEEAEAAVGIDLTPRFREAGDRLAREKGRGNLRFLQADGTALPFADRTFDLVLSHAVIEHVADARRYMRECARVLRPGGRMYLSTAPYLSFAGAHLPRLRLPLPLHLIVGRKAAFGTFRFLARHAAWTLREPANENSFIKAARRNERKRDDLLEKVRVRRLRDQIAAAGLTTVREQLHVTGTFRRAPGGLADWLRDSPLTQDIVIGNVEYVLARP
ncbi:MAG: class I SAM-dependent methyltransferase [Acidobacteria bacterium]|nr:class I SAM-dependent methyltransferase [Acidobacteriota bacterium]